MKKERNIKIIIGSALFLLFGIICFIVGYGLVNGWQAVIDWFSSPYATILYIGVIFLAFIVAYLIYLAKSNPSDNQ